MRTVEQRVTKILADIAHLDESQVSLNDRLTQDLHLDSLDAVEAVMAVEEDFDIEIPDVEAEGLATVEEVVKVVRKYYLS